MRLLKYAISIILSYLIIGALNAYIHASWEQIAIYCLIASTSVNSVDIHELEGRD